MERTAEIKFSLVLLVSFFLHVIGLAGIFLPDYQSEIMRRDARERMIGGRDIIVNINEDDRRVESSSTLLSERDSSAKGYITRRKGDNWLNNSLEFKVKRGTAKTGRDSMRKSVNTDSSLLLSDTTELVISLMKEDFSGARGESGGEDFTAIPDRYSFSRENSIYYSNDGRFSFNTKKFRNFKYFKAMKDKIAAHWYPPLLANSVIGGYDPVTGAYTPGRLRIMAIPSQEVKLYFTMDRAGDVLNVEIIDSMGNVPLDSSCVDAIRLSKNFGAVPDDITGKVIIIPFVFGYFVY